jgi:hypothetical protein
MLKPTLQCFLVLILFFSSSTYLFLDIVLYRNLGSDNDNDQNVLIGT